MSTICKQVQDQLLLYVESEQSGQLELYPDEMTFIADHLQSCQACRSEKIAIKKNIERLATVSIPQPTSALASRCLPCANQTRRSFNNREFKLAGGFIAACFLLTIGYLAGGLQHRQPTTVTSSQTSMSDLFQQQNELITELEKQIQQTGINPNMTHGVSLVGLKQSAHLVKYVYESSSPDVVVSESIRHITEQNIQLLESVTQYLKKYEEKPALPMQEI